VRPLIHSSFRSCSFPPSGDWQYAEGFVVVGATELLLVVGGGAFIVLGAHVVVAEGGGWIPSRSTL
jgi:hypothetical protein